MDKKILFDKRVKLFFIGIGGISMSGLAKFLKAQGYSVGGSDKIKSRITAELEALGVSVYYSHDKANIEGYDLIVYSSAINEENEQLKFARENGLVILRRSELLGLILNGFKRSVGISGCHGKTTATAMLSLVALQARQNPTVFLGGEYAEQGNLIVGEGDLAIAEVCEYKKSFLDINPKIAVVLNLDNDHLDSFNGMKDVVSSFKQFVGDRLAVINADEKYINELSNCTTVTFGIDNVATYYATEVKESENGVSFTACAYAKPYGRINLSVNGKHNVYNALSAFAVADMLGISFLDIKRGLEKFKGVKRRNEFLGEKNGLAFYADYAHHPTEINATICAFNSIKRDFITVFQPHTYSRTKLLMKDFIQALEKLDNVIIYKSYPAREKYQKSGSAKLLSERLQDKVPICLYAHTPKELKKEIIGLKTKNGQLKRVIFLGAGDVYQIALNILKKI